MAGADDEGTLEPSEHRLREAHGRGDWPATGELGLALTWPILALAATWAGPSMAQGLVRFTQALWSERALGGELDPGSLFVVTSSKLVLPLVVLGAVMVVTLGIAVLGQKGWVLKNPVQEFRVPAPAVPVRRASDTLSSLALGAATISLTMLWVFRQGWPGLRQIVPFSSTSFTGSWMGLFVLWCVVALVDHRLRRARFLRSLAMTPREMKAEAREQGGDPRIRGRILERAQQGMARGPFRPVVLVEGDRAVVVMLFGEASRAPLVMTHAAGESARKLVDLQRRAKAMVTPAPGLASIWKELRPGEAVPARLHPVLASIHRGLFPTDERRAG